MKRSMIMTAALTVVLALFVPLASAQTTQPAAQDPKQEEAAAYKAYYDANAAKDWAKAYEAAKAYVAKFPSGQYADYLKKTGIPQARGFLFDAAAKAKNTAEMVRLAKEALAENPENVDYPYLVSVNIRQNELFANPPNNANAAQAAEFTQQAIKLIEAGKVPTVIPKDKWKQNERLANLYWTLAIIEQRGKNTDKAIEYYKKASTLDANNPAFFLNCGLLHQEKYLSAVQKYQAIPEADRTAAEPKPEVKAALDEVNNQADLVINCWARYLGLTAAEPSKAGPARPQVEKALTELYKYRHNDSTEGLQKLIDQHRTGTPPTSSSSPSSTGTKP